MGIESTITVKRSDAIRTLKDKGCIVYENDCRERLADILYENRETIYENYQIVEDDYDEEKLPLLTLHNRCPADPVLIQLAKQNCMLHRTSDDLGFMAMFDLNDLRKFCSKLLKGNA